jgi:hypothetical protein
MGLKLTLPRKKIECPFTFLSFLKLLVSLYLFTLRECSGDVALKQVITTRSINKRPSSVPLDNSGLKEKKILIIKKPFIIYSDFESIMLQDKFKEFMSRSYLVKCRMQIINIHGGLPSPAFHIL